MENFYELQPLRIQGGWKVEYNNFTEYDLDQDDKDNAFEFLIEDLLQLSYCSPGGLEDIMIDLGWYPAGSINGSYSLTMIKDYNWSAPIEKLVTSSKKEIIAALEKWVCFDFFSKYL